MYAKETNKKIKTYNVLPSNYNGKKYYLSGFNLLSDDELADEGFYKVEIPEYDSRVQELKDLKFNKTKGKFVYSLKNKTFSESVSELKNKVLENLKTKRDFKLEPTKNLALEAYETGAELSQKVKDERDAIRKQYDDDVVALNKLTKKVDIVKFI
tara:strand:- start:631 stop:1095 length:465 start_codon:yes stop_codon:yes gene_type:complete